MARLTNHEAPLELKAYTLHSLLDVVRSKVSTQADAAGFTLRFLAQERPMTSRRPPCSSMRMPSCRSLLILSTMP